MARQSAQLFPALKATFFGDFLFCPKRKLPPAGKALTPQTTEESAKPKPINKRHSEQIKSVNSYRSQAKKAFCARPSCANSYYFHSTHRFQARPQKPARKILRACP
jgi:hypothetical protein